MKDFCAFCEHYIGGGDWNLCCDQKYGLCYAHTEACELFKENPVAKRAFLDGIRMYRAAIQNREPRSVSIKTNADKIRAMTDEELADFMVGVAQNGGVPTGGKIMRWLDWLKQECADG